METKRKDNKKLYTILKVEPDATIDQIKKSYKRLALIHHPDKNINDLEKFKEIKHAYEILTDQKKRRVYDKYGEWGLNMMDTVGERAFDEDIESKIGWLFFIINSFTILLVLFFSFLSAKDDQTILWKYSIIFIPLWLIDCLTFLAAFNLIYNLIKQYKEDNKEGQNEQDDVLNNNQEKMDKATFKITLFIFSLIIFVILMISLFQILIVLKVDQVIELSGLIIFIPMIILEVLLFIKHLIGIIMKYKGENENDRHIIITLTKTYWIQLLRIVQIILIILKLDLVISSYWSIIFIPTYLIGLKYFIQILINFYVNNRDHTITSEQKNTEKVKLIFILISFIIISIFVYSFLGLLIKKLDDPTSIRLVIVFVPIFILLSFLLCCFGCCIPCCCFVAMNSNLGEELSEQVTPILISPNRLITMGNSTINANDSLNDSLDSSTPLQS